MFENIILEQNMHWQDELAVDGIKRDCFPKLLDYLNTPLIVAITGIRRSGKSTLMRQLISYLIQQSINPKNILFLNLEHPYFSQYRTEIKYLEKIYEDYLKLANPEGKIYLLLDEIQFLSDWPVFIKAHYEQKNIKFIITGSNSALLSNDLVTLLSGRTLPLEIFPLSFPEYLSASNIQIKNDHDIILSHHRLRKEIEEYITFGGFPEVTLLANKSVRFDILSSYVRTILYQDIAPRLGLRKFSDLEKLFVYLSTNTSKLFSYNQLSKLFDLSDKAIKEYLQAFADAYLIFQLEHFSFSLKKQIRSNKKIYFIDTGLINSLAFKFSNDYDHHLENLVFLGLRRVGVEIYYFKTKQGYEIDFLIKKSTEIALIQACWNISNPITQQREINALYHAIQELKLHKGIIVTSEHKEIMIKDDYQIEIIPIYEFLLQIEELIKNVF